MSFTASALTVGVSVIVGVASGMGAAWLSNRHADRQRRAEIEGMMLPLLGDAIEKARFALFDISQYQTITTGRDVAEAIEEAKRFAHYYSPELREAISSLPPEPDVDAFEWYLEKVLPLLQREYEARAKPL